MSIKDSTFYILAIHMYAESKNIRILNRSVYRGRNNVPSCVTYRLVAFNVAAESSVKWSTWAEGPLKCNDHIKNQLVFKGLTHIILFIFKGSTLKEDRQIQCVFQCKIC